MIMNASKYKFKNLSPMYIKLLLRRFCYYPIDLLLPRKKLPPRRLMFGGVGNFKKTGDEFLDYLQQLCNLKPNVKILDAGCGIGRMALPLTKYLDENGVYEGFDILKPQIDWLKANITPKYPNFNFYFADVFNKHYNPNGQIMASNYRFFHNNDYFDLVFATSVFTHMLPKDMENYLSEISRVLKEGGKTLFTFFLLNNESEQLIGNKNKELMNLNLKFKYDFGEYFSISKEYPEVAVSYDEHKIISLLKSNGFSKIKIFYGSWPGRRDFLSYQDIITAAKKST